MHLAAGIWSAVFLLILTLTGLVIAFDDEIVTKLYAVTSSKAPVRNTPSVVQPGVLPITPDQALDAAKAALPDAAPLSISLPANFKASYMIVMRHPEDLTPGGRSWVNIDQYSGKPVYVQSSRTAVMPARTIIINRAIHTGDAFGYPSKVVVSLSSLILVLQAITGVYLWWKKRGSSARPLSE